VMATAAPSFAKRRAVASPIPEVPPVINETLLSKRIGGRDKQFGDW